MQEMLSSKKCFHKTSTTIELFKTAKKRRGVLIVGMRGKLKLSLFYWVTLSELTNILTVS